MKTIKTLELFGGIGAPRCALENLNAFDIKAVDYVEIISNAVKAYNAMYDLSYKPQDVLEWNLNVDLLVHGSPCQDWSSAGLNDVNTGRSILYQRTLEIIEKELNPRPKYVLWENVVGLVKNHYKHFNHYIKTMESLGYKSYYSTLEAREFGIPQTRPRIFVVSIRNDINQAFDFDVLERLPLKPIKDFLYADTDITLNKSVDINCPSMVKEVENGRIKIIYNLTKTITSNQLRRDNSGIVVKDNKFYDIDFSKYPKPKCASGYTLNEFLNYFPEFYKGSIEKTFRLLTPRECWSLQGFTVKQPSMQKAIENNKCKIIVDKTATITTKQVRWNSAGVVFIDESFYEQDFSKIPPSKSIYGYSFQECKEYFPKYFEGKKDLSEVFRYLTPRECWALQGYEVKEKTYKEFENFYTIPRSTDGKLINGSYNRVWKVDKFVGTIPANLVLKIGEVNEAGELEYRELTPYECWKLQGYNLSQFDRVKATGISDTDMYALAGNSICVPVLEAIFKELLIDKKSKTYKYYVSPMVEQLNIFGEYEEVENFKKIKTRCKNDR